MSSMDSSPYGKQLIVLSNCFERKLPDYNKKAMGGIEFTDEHGLYSISMSSDKRAISIDSLWASRYQCLTGITISAPQRECSYRRGKTSISWRVIICPFLRKQYCNPTLAYERQEVERRMERFWQDDGYRRLIKIEVIDMNLIRTAFETIVRPCGGTMLIKSNRYLCFEAGKGEAQIAGRQTVKQLGLRNTFKHLKPDLFETTIQYNPNILILWQRTEYQYI